MRNDPYVILTMVFSSAVAVRLTARSAKGGSECWRYLASNVKNDSSHFRRTATEFRIDNNRVHKFIIFSTLRSGSNLLTHALDGLPGVMSNSEIFSADGIWPSRWLQNWKDGKNRDDFLSGWDLAERDRHRSAFINAVSRHANERNFTHCGFKVLANQLYAREFQSLVKAPFIKKIILYRRNVLRQYVSKLKADTVSRWYGTNTSATQVHVNITKFLWFAKDVKLCYTSCLIPSMAPNTWRPVAYEDLVNDYDKTMSSILDFLQYQGQARHQTRMTKQDTSPLSNSIDNFMEVAQALSNTEYNESIGTG